MSVNNVFNSVRQYLSSQYMYAHDEWITGCVDFLTSDNSNNLSEHEIRNLAKEQWLLNDLKDICPGSLPANLLGQGKTVLSGKYLLQINAAIDIGTPAYQQYLKLQKVNMENVEVTTKFEDKITSHRMLKLYLTDGVQEITGIEYRTMRNLSCDITPGCKILLKGPVDCRRGMVLLTENAVELLGGEVSEFAETNCLAGLLSSKLGLPRIQEIEQKVEIPCSIPEDKTEPSHKRPFTDENVRPEKKFKSENEPDDYPDDDFFLNEDDEYLRQIDEEIERNMNDGLASSTDVGNVLKVSNNITSKVNASEDNRIVTVANKITSKPNASEDNRNGTVASNITSKANASEDNRRGSVGMKTEETSIRSTAKGMDITNYLVRKTPEPLINSSNINKTRNELIEPVKYPLTIPPEPYVYIKQILDLPESERVGRVFKVKAQIMKLLSKLVVGKDNWNLKCTIIDGTGTLDVEFTSEVLSELVGFTPQEMNQLKKEMVSKPEVREKAVKALYNAKDALQVLYCIIELTILEVPKITKLIPFEESHVNMLKLRMQSTNL